MSGSRALAFAVAILAWSMLSVAAALACDGDRYPCPAAPPSAGPPPALGTPLALQNSGPAKRAVLRKPRAGAAETESATAAKPAQSETAEPRGAPTAGVEVFDTPFTDGVRVYDDSEMTALDLLASGVPETPMLPREFARPQAETVSFRTVQFPPGAPAASAAPAQQPEHADLLQRIIITFGSAFGAASALRLFIG